MSRSCPSSMKQCSESSSTGWSESLTNMEDIATEVGEFTKSATYEESDGSDEKSIAQSNSDIGSDEDVVAKQSRTLLSRIDEFRQSYNRTHGQVLEFFERARAVQKLGLLDPSQSAQLIPLSGDEADEDDCNSNVDCTYADGQKTTGMKRKLRKWRKVMRSALIEICPDLGIDNTPDIVNPGLMKHILDEVRNLKSQLAFQHTNILQLAHKTEMYRVDCEQKEQFIADLLQNCKGIRLDSEAPLDAQIVSEGAASKNPTTEEPLPSSLDEIQFGRSREVINALNLDAQTLTGDAEQLVADPIDFFEAQKQLQQIAKQNDASEVISHPSSFSKADGPSVPFLADTNPVLSRGMPTFDIQSRMMSREFAPDTNASSNSAYRGSSNVGVTHTHRSEVERKRRRFFMNVGGSLTAALVGGLVIGSMHRRGKE